MNETKAWYLSRSMWGGIIMGAATLLQITGVANITEADQAALVDIVLTGAQLVGAAVAIYGRYAAKASLTL